MLRIDRNAENRQNAENLHQRNRRKKMFWKIQILYVDMCAVQRYKNAKKVHLTTTPVIDTSGLPKFNID